MSSLTKRILTAVALIPFVLWLVLLSPADVFIVIFSGVMLVAAFEWAGLSGISQLIPKLLFAVLIVLASNLLLLANQPVLIAGLMTGLVFWLVLIGLIITVPRWLLSIKVKPFYMQFIGGFLLSLTFVSLVYLKQSVQEGDTALMYLLLLIWVADSGAYFSGRAFGKHKLSIHVSPAKSIEGLLGGMVLCLLLSVIAVGYFEQSQVALFTLFSLGVAWVSVYGDLFESLVKRRAGVKDSGHILPGHGGILDRIDSLLAAAPFFVAFYILMELLS